MTARQWWVGIALLALALVFHAAFPRYEWRASTGRLLIRVDRWTGHAQLGAFNHTTGVWEPRLPQ